MGAGPTEVVPIVIRLHRTMSRMTAFVDEGDSDEGSRINDGPTAEELDHVVLG